MYNLYGLTKVVHWFNELFQVHEKPHLNKILSYLNSLNQLSLNHYMLVCGANRLFLLESIQNIFSKRCGRDINSENDIEKFTFIGILNVRVNSIIFVTAYSFILIKQIPSHYLPHFAFNFGVG